MQPQPPRPGRRRRRRRRACRRGAARVQHHRGLRQPVAGHAGHARVAGLARGDRRLDRAHGRGARLRCARVHRGLRQDRAGRPDGARAHRQAGDRAVQRPDARRALARRAGDDPGRLGGGRGGAARGAVAGRARRPRASCVPGSGGLRGELHRDHDGPRARVPRDHPARHVDGAGGRRRSSPRRCRALRRAGDARRSAALEGAALARLAAERDDRDRGERRVDQRRPAPARDRARGRRRARLRRSVRGGRAGAGDREPEPGRPFRGDRPGRGGRRAGPRARADRRRLGRRRPADRRGGAPSRSAPPARPSRTARSTARAATPFKPVSGLVGLRGNLAPDGAVAKVAGTERRVHTGPARVFESEADCIAAIGRRAIDPGDVLVIRNEGPAGGPACGRCSASPRLSWAPGSASR